MAKTTVYTCDLCKQSKSEKDLAKIEVKTEGIIIKGCDRYSPLKIDICKDCLKRKGFIVETQETPEENGVVEGKNKLTLEDKLYDILEDMGVAFRE